MRAVHIGVIPLDEAALLTDLESDRVQRKASLAASDRIRQALCASANDLPARGLPGVLIIGPDDDGSPRARAATTNCAGTSPPCVPMAT